METPAPDRNRGEDIPCVDGTTWGFVILAGLYVGAPVGWVLSMLFASGARPQIRAGIMIAVMVVVIIWTAIKTPRLVCGDQTCRTPVAKETAVCAGCGARVAPVLRGRALREYREAQLDRDD